MISTIFNFLSALLGLAETASHNIQTKINDSKPSFKAKLDAAAADMRKKSAR